MNSFSFSNIASSLWNLSRTVYTSNFVIKSKINPTSYRKKSFGYSPLPNSNSKLSYDSELPFFGPTYWLRILLVRHGESLGNKDKNLLKIRADHAIPLSEEGRSQSKQAGKILKDFFERSDRDILSKGLKVHRRLWVSPYRRARETADEIMKETGEYISDRREHILLGEQQFGLFEGHPIDELEKLYPQEYSYFTKCIESEGRFWARTPLGESRFDVAKRVHQAFGSFHRDAQFHEIKNIVVVSHGVALRAFAMMWLHLSPEWFEKESNPDLCSIRLLEDNVDKGYIFHGFKSADKREDPKFY